MKRTLAFLFGLLMVWQAVNSATTPVGVARGAASCCSCAQGCCVSKGIPASQSTPTAPVRTVFQQEFSILPATAALWVMPDAAALSSSFFAPLPLTAAGVPLFSRNCARLL